MTREIEKPYITPQPEEQVTELEFAYVDGTPQELILGTFNELVTPKFHLDGIEYDSLGFPVGQPGG